MEKRFVYADNAATTKVSKPVLDVMMPYFTEEYGNASSIYALGRSAKKALETARETVAKAIGAETSEIYFTSCGSESDNWAIRSVCERLAAKGKKHIVTSVFEHHAVLHTCQALEKLGFEVTYLPVYKNGIVKTEDVKMRSVKILRLLPLCTPTMRSERSSLLKKLPQYAVKRAFCSIPTQFRLWDM